MDTPSSAYAATNAAVYAHDFYAWCLTTAELVRSGQWDAIDPEALVEELESLGVSQKHELESRLEVLMMHLLKWEFQPQGHEDSHSWYDTIVEQRQAIARVLRDSPSLRRLVPDLLTGVYAGARTRAIGAMGVLGPLLPGQGPLQRASTLDVRELVRRSMLPTTCPWNTAEVLDPEFWPLPLP